MKKRIWPTVSIVTPTLNSERTLELCLSSVVSQDYLGKIEVVVADGGSIDKTLEIAKKYGAKIVVNKLKTGEAGKAAGAKKAKGEILAFIDSDNVLPNKNWLAKMILPFLRDREIIATEPLYFTYRKKDYWLTRYFALLGMGDPLGLFVGNYDRYSFVSNSWTQLPIRFEDKGDYLLLYLRDEFPTIGANGFLIKGQALKSYPISDYLFDIDVLKFLAKNQSLKVAKVKTGIIHLFSGSVATFVRKQRRRIKDFLYFRKMGLRASGWSNSRMLWGIAKFIISTLIIVPLIFQMLRGFIKRPDKAWLFHPLACWLTLLAYSYEFGRSFFGITPFERKRWSQ